MWRPNSFPMAAGPAGIEPTQVLYRYDVPRVFLAREGLTELLFYNCDEDEDNERLVFLAKVISPKEREFVSKGELSLRGVLGHGNLFAVELDFSFSRKASWLLNAEDVPDEILPKFGVGIDYKKDWVADSIDQLECFLAFRFSGQQVQGENFSLKQLRDRVSGVYESLKMALLPPEAQGSRKNLFDFRVREPALGSLVLSIEEVDIDGAALAKHLKVSNQKQPEFRSDLLDRRGEIFNFFDWLEKIQTLQSIDAKERGAAIRMLQSLIDILPAEKSDFGKVDISFSNGTKIHHRTITRTEGQRIRTIYNDAITRSEDVAGRITIINARSSKFTIITDWGRQITAQVAVDEFNKLKKNSLFTTGASVVVSGDLQRRKQRDLIQAKTVELDSS